MIIAIDGPTASGKSTLAKGLAQALGILYLDTGATYRAAALYAMQQNVDFDNADACSQILESCEIRMTCNNGELQVFLNGLDVTQDIRLNDVSQVASRISVHSEVRKKLVNLQREIANSQNVVAEGRDIGSVVFPNADLKIYLEAPHEERTKRRISQLSNLGQNKDICQIDREIRERDYRDMNRPDSPLIRTSDAVYINNDGFTKQMTLQVALDVIHDQFPGYRPE